MVSIRHGKAANNLYYRNLGNAMKNGRFKRFVPFYVMAVPGILYLFINNYLPLPWLAIAFEKYSYTKGLFKSPFVGLQNFEYLFKTKDAWIITRNTVGYNLVWIVLTMAASVAVAIFLNEIVGRKTKKFYQTAILLPHLISTVIISYIVFAFLSENNGFLNSIITALGGEPVKWYSNPAYWPFILTLVNLWKSIGFTSVIYLSSIIGFDKALYESAEIGGASKWQQIRFITLPLLKPTMVTMLILNFGKIFRSDFGLFYQVPKDIGLLYSTTNTLDTYVYRSFMINGDIAMSAAAGFYQSVVCFVFMIVANKVVRKFNDGEAIF